MTACDVGRPAARDARFDAAARALTEEARLGRWRLSPVPLSIHTEAATGCAVELEQHLDGPGGGTLGWLARYADGRALWCGELSRADFRRLPADVRAALRDDLGWFLVEYESIHPTPVSRVLAKVAGEEAAPELLRLVLLGRLHEAGVRVERLVTQCIAGAGDAPVARPPPAGWAAD